MRSVVLLCWLGLFTPLQLSAAPANTGHKPLTGVYKVYGGDLGDPVAASASDAKVMFSIIGNAARQLFDQIGPDAKSACTEGSGIRLRMKDEGRIVCTRDGKNEYRCNFGFDLKSGKSIGGSVC